jgi:4-hydroxybenzoate polyprenyltransferase
LNQGATAWPLLLLLALLLLLLLLEWLLRGRCQQPERQQVRRVNLQVLCVCAFCCPC